MLHLKLFPAISLSMPAIWIVRWTRKTVLYVGPTILHCLKKNDTDVAHYNFNAHQLILVIFDRDVAE